MTSLLHTHHIYPAARHPQPLTEHLQADTEPTQSTPDISSRKTSQSTLSSGSPRQNQRDRPDCSTISPTAFDSEPSLKVVAKKCIWVGTSCQSGQGENLLMSTLLQKSAWINHSRPLLELIQVMINCHNQHHQSTPAGHSCPDTLPYHCSASPLPSPLPPKPQEAEYQPPKKGLYYRNRISLVQWIRTECFKLQLSRQSFGCALFLMDSYYKQSPFDSEEFLPTALCMLALGAKINDRIRLHPVNLGKTCDIPPQTMLDKEQHLLEWFQFDVDCHNFVRVVCEYMCRWDSLLIKQNIEGPQFYRDNLQSYLLQQKLFYVCERQLQLRGDLTTPLLKTVFSEVLTPLLSQEKLCGKLLQIVFLADNLQAEQQTKYLYERSQQSLAQLSNNVKEWMGQFEQTKHAELKNRYLTAKDNGLPYQQFVHLQP